MFDFLRGRMRGMGGGQQQGAGFMGRMRDNFQRPQMQQAAGAIGAQMMGLDPSLGAGAVQGFQNRRLQQGFNQAIQPIQRQAMPMPGLERPAVGFAPLGGGSAPSTQPGGMIMPRTPRLNEKPGPNTPVSDNRFRGPMPFDGPPTDPFPREPVTGIPGGMPGSMGIPQQQVQAPMGAEGLGGGSWQDPRLRELLYGQRFPSY